MRKPPSGSKPLAMRRAAKYDVVTYFAVALMGATAWSTAVAQSVQPKYLDQGDDWTNVARADFYTHDQGSRLIPKAWLDAIEQTNGQPFLADQLSRYGYLANPGNPSRLPVGFTVNDQYAGMNCAACHTRQIVVEGESYRVDGGPALVDAQSMLADLNDAIGHVLSSDEAFEAFAKRVLGPPNGPPIPAPNDVVRLKEEVEAWHLRFDTQMSRGLPMKSWGPGRMDAVGMIFNRLTGLDIGRPPTYIIAENIRPADAPVRYPFLWNAAKQDKTQWPGFADNGSDILGLSRNLGEVYGVFADFFPKDEWWRILGVDYLHYNSANFDGLRRLEKLIKLIGPPKYPWPVDRALAERGGEIYKRSTADGGCIDCHGITPGETRFYNNKTWKTPLMDVGTDTREYQVLSWTAKTGVLEGKHVPLLTEKLKPVDKSFNVLKLAVLGSIIQQETRGSLPANAEPLALSAEGPFDETAAKRLSSARSEFDLPSQLQDLKGAFATPNEKVIFDSSISATEATTSSYVYESRVLQGIWATAPYLHNGSVPTLADLLEPTNMRPTKFKIGPNYDINRLGMAKHQTKFGGQTLEVTPQKRDSGNSNAGHEYGTTLSQEDKRALLEYLKIL